MGYVHKTYLDRLPTEIVSYIQLFIEDEDIDNWSMLHNYYNQEIYWKYFYSYYIKKWKLVLNNKPENISYLEQYKQLCKSITYNYNIGWWNTYSTQLRGRLYQSIKEGRSDIVFYLLSPKNIRREIKMKILPTPEKDPRFFDANGIYGKGSNDPNFFSTKEIYDGLSINGVDYEGYTALCKAARYGRINIVKYLIENGAEIDKTIAKHEFSPLMEAIYKNHDEVAIYLVEHGANIDYKNNCLCTPLMQAVYRKNLKMVKYLVERGADVNARDDEGLTALDDAISEGYTEIGDFLKGCINKKIL